MTSKQLFISFLMCSFISLNAWQHSIQQMGKISGVGVPDPGINVDDFLDLMTEENPPTEEAVQQPTVLQFPSPDEEPSNPDTGMPQTPNGHSPSHDDSAHVVDQVLGGSHDTTNIVPEHVRVAEHLHTVHSTTRILPEKAHAVIAWLQAIHPRYVIMAGIGGGIIVAGIGYRWWQRHQATQRINTVLKQYGKNLSTVSHTHAMLLHAAYKKDIHAVHNYIERYGMESVQGEHNAWVMPALEQLYVN